jgi:ubiquinone/menaquinone biosynthesis C-methylase UbiE
MNTFDKVSNQYADKSLVQKNAGVKLIERLQISNTDSILDVACGPGNITNELKNMTKGKVVGTDVSGGMIARARKSYPKIEFVEVSAEALNYKNEFDVVFCNSALQWFKEPQKALHAMAKSLKPGGKIGLACPGTNNWCPFFLKVIGKVGQLPEIKQVFKYWQNPWFHLDNQEGYKELFEKAGFKTLLLSVDYEIKNFSVDDAFGVYLSGASNGFIKKEYYAKEVSDDFFNTFNIAVKREFEKESKNGEVGLDFNRLYYIGVKT